MQSAIPIFDPATAERIGETPDGGKAAVDLAVTRARETFDSGTWRRVVPRQRAKIMWLAADIIERRIDELIEIEARNNGMSRMLARNLVRAGAEIFRY